MTFCSYLDVCGIVDVLNITIRLVIWKFPVLKLLISNMLTFSINSTKLCEYIRYISVAPCLGYFFNVNSLFKNTCCYIQVFETNEGSTSNAVKWGRTCITKLESISTEETVAKHPHYFITEDIVCRMWPSVLGKSSL